MMVERMREVLNAAEIFFLIRSQKLECLQSTQLDIYAGTHSHALVFPTDYIHL